MKLKNLLVVFLGILMVMLSNCVYATNMYALNRVNLRVAPSTDAKIISVIDTNEVVIGKAVTEDSNKKPWVLCETKHGEGYISYYSLAKEGTTAAEHYKTGSYASIDLSKPTLRAESSVEEETVILIVKSDTKVTINGKKIKLKKGTEVESKYFYSDGKAQIVLADGQICKVATKYLKTIEGKSVPKMAKSVKLKEEMIIGGKLIKAGKKIKVNYYVFSDGELYACTNNEYINTKYIK